MGTTKHTLLEQLRMTKNEIARRKEYLSFTNEDCKTLFSLKQTITDNIVEIIDEFYKRIIIFSEMDHIIGDAETLQKLKNHLRNYILSLFDGQYDEDYVHSRLRVGVVHKRIGVSPKYYLTAAHNLSIILRAIISRDKGTGPPNCQESLISLEKILTFDLSLIFDTYINSLMEEARRSKEELEQYTESLEEVIAERTKDLKEQARYDGLTGLLNQQYFYIELRKELARSHRRGHCTTLIYFDLDGFKQVNDNQGHNKGDQLLVTVAETLRKTTRENEMAARYGGDEFCIIMPESTSQEALLLSRRICDALKASMNDTGVTCSVGIASSTPDRFLDANTLVKISDKAMYAAKKEKGFAIHVAETDHE